MAQRTFTGLDYTRRNTGAGIAKFGMLDSASVDGCRKFTLDLRQAPALIPGIPMQYLAISEYDLLFHFMRNVAAKQAEVLFLVQDPAVAKRIKLQGGNVRQGDLLKEETYKKLKLHHVDQAIVFVRAKDLQERICRLLRNLEKSLSIVVLTADKAEEPGANDKLLSYIRLTEVFVVYYST